MKLKPKTTTLEPRGILFKRFTAIEKAQALDVYYQTVDGLCWFFDMALNDFVEVLDYESLSTKNKVYVTPSNVYVYNKKYFMYDAAYGWQTVQEGNLTNLAQAINYNGTIAKYQTNKYYKVGTFSFMIRGSINNTTSQFIKGNIMPLRSLSIKHFDDDINIQPDDLVVVENRVYSVESVEQDHKHMPRDFNIYFATLNSIL